MTPAATLEKEQTTTTRRKYDNAYYHSAKKHKPKEKSNKPHKICTSCNRPILVDPTGRATVHPSTTKGKRSECQRIKDVEKSRQYRKDNPVVYMKPKIAAGAQTRFCIGHLCNGKVKFKSKGAHNRRCDKCLSTAPTIAIYKARLSQDDFSPK